MIKCDKCDLKLCKAEGMVRIDLPHLGPEVDRVDVFVPISDSEYKKMGSYKVCCGK